MATRIEKNYDHRIKKIFNHLHDFDLHPDDSSLHDLRVEMKKLRALLKFLRTIYPQQKLKKAAHLLRTVFHAAGEIREFQLMQQWCRANNIYHIESTYYPQEELDHLILNFKNALEGYKKDLEEMCKKSQEFVQDTHIILAEQYVTDLYAQLDTKTHIRLASEEWHELRKIIKQWMYALDWIHESKTEKKDQTFSFYNKLQEIIGQWHDLEMIKESFSQKQIFLSMDLDVQQDFARAWDLLLNSIKKSAKQVTAMLAKHREINSA